MTGWRMPASPLYDCPARSRLLCQRWDRVAGRLDHGAGSDANDGLTPATPKASIQAVLAAYDLSPGDVIRVDDGTYDLDSNILLAAADSGITIEGYNDASYPGRAAVLDRGNTNGGQYVFQLAGATGVTLEDLAITGGYDGIYAEEHGGQHAPHGLQLPGLRQRQL